MWVSMLKAVLLCCILDIHPHLRHTTAHLLTNALPLLLAAREAVPKIESRACEECADGAGRQHGG